MDYLRPYGKKIVTVEEANRMIKEFQAVAVAVATKAGWLPTHDLLMTCSLLAHDLLRTYS